MGMFDHLACKYPLPLTDKLRELDVNWSNMDFQTKDLDCSLSMYHITEEGLLLEEVIEREYVPYSEKELAEQKKSKDKFPKWSFSPWKEVVVKNKYMKPVSHHGTITFYDTVSWNDTEDMWVDFVAYFIYGKLDKIVLQQTKLYKSSLVINKEIEEEMTKRQNLPWNKFKHFMGHAGWYWFWRKMSNFSCLLYQFFSDLQRAIIKHML